MAKAIGTLGTVDTLTVGGRVFTDLTTLIIAGGYAATSGRWTTLRKMTGTAGYQVTTGKTFTMHAIQILSDTAGGASGPMLLYGDTDVGLNSAAAPTNPVYSTGDSSTGFVGIVSQATSGTYYHLEQLPGVNFQVPALKYPCIKAYGTGSACYVYGYET